MTDTLNRESQIASNSITSDKIYSGAITTAKLSTDAIKSQNYSAPGYYDDGYAQQGSYLNLSNGSFTSKNLVIDNYGNLKLKGNVTATSGSFTGSVYANAGTIGGCSIQNGSLKVPAANITGNLSASQITVGYNNLQTQLNTMTNNISSATGCSIQNGSLKVPAANITGNLSASQITVGYNNLQTQLNTMTNNISSATSTANSASSTASSALNKANSASTAASNAASTANTANSTANNALNKATDAAKTATNFVKLEYGGITVGNLTEYGGITVGNLTNYYLGNNVFIDSDSVDIRNGTTVLASFAANQIDLGKNNTNAVINLCNNIGKITSYYDSEWGITGTKLESHAINLVAKDTVFASSSINSSVLSKSESVVQSTASDDSSNVCMEAFYKSINSTHASIDVISGPYEYDTTIQLHITGAKNVNSVGITEHNTTFYKLVNVNEGLAKGNIRETFQNKLLWSGERYPTANQTSVFQEPVSDQPHGILLVFSGYNTTNSNSINADWNTFFVSKREIAEHLGAGHGFLMSSTNLNRVCQKYIYIDNTSLWGHDQNNKTGTGSSGASYTNNAFVLRYVFGV